MFATKILLEACLPDREGLAGLPAEPGDSLVDGVGYEVVVALVLPADKRRI
jgi:hypothetical protein